jgi:hypothetical protein
MIQKLIHFSLSLCYKKFILKMLNYSFLLKKMDLMQYNFLKQKIKLKAKKILI